MKIKKAFKTIMTIAVFLLVCTTVGCYEDSGSEGSASIMKVTIYSWPGGKIPYSIDGEFTEKELIYIENAMAEWSSYCNIEFIDYTNENELPARTLIIEKTDGTSSTTVGYARNPSLKVTNQSKVYQRHFVLLFGHIIGLLKEHQRPDRDKYITIHWENIHEYAISHYTKIDSTLIEEENFMYDTASVMHYTRTQGNKSFGLRCFDYNSGEDYTRAHYVSEGDAEKVSFIYGLPGSESEATEPATTESRNAFPEDEPITMTLNMTEEE